MTVFEEIVEADYEEPTKDVLEWLDESEKSASHDDNAIHAAPQEDSSPPLLFGHHRNPHHLTADRHMPNTNATESYEDLAKRCNHILSLHNELLNLEDPLKRSRCIEALACALLEFSLPDVWEVAKDIGEHNAPLLLYIMQSWLDRAPVNHPWRRRVLYLLVKMAAANQALPEQLFLDGVVFDDVQNPWRSGGFADIFKGTFQGIKVVGKRIRVYSVNKRALHHSTICNETLVWKQLKHPSILPFFGLDRRSSGSTETLYLVAPLMQCTLWEFITEATDYHAHSDLYRLLWEVSDGLSYLHAAKVVHGDINNMNILISHDRRAQIADFGLTIVGDVTVGRMSTRKPGSGTVRWMSPERLLSDEPKRLERSDDVYAFGGLIYMMFSHKLPWDGLSDPAVYRRAGLKSLPGSRLDCNTPCGMSIPDEAWRLVEACWSDAGLRPDLPHIQKIIAMLKESPVTSILSSTDCIITQASHSQSMDTNTGTLAKSIPPLFIDNPLYLANASAPSTSGPSQMSSLRHRQSRHQSPWRSPPRSPSCSPSPPLPTMGLSSLGESDDDEGVTGGY